jgi:hypothetical protein
MPGWKPPLEGGSGIWKAADLRQDLVDHAAAAAGAEDPEEGMRILDRLMREAKTYAERVMLLGYGEALAMRRIGYRR